ncbi:phosphatase PAP2 family protein [Mycolicibacterium sp.]|uniref:phosphatase PAP2 family protein n=1 Tax=Mycolicibacterium sp. TaxID=2320850 RepID=UPI0037C5AA0B
MTALVVAALLIWSLVFIWVARHQDFFVAALTRLSETGLAVAVRTWAIRRLGAPLTRLAQWLSVDVAAALGLVSGIVLVALLAAGFTELLDDVLEGELDTYVDQPVGQWFAANRDAWLTAVMKVLTHVGDPLSLVAIVVSVSAWVCWRIRSWAPALLGLFGLIGVGVVLVVAKWMVGRNRPPSWTAVIVEDGFSFPSGHATGGFAVAVLLAWMAGSVIRGWTARVTLWACALTAAGIVAFSRVYLGVHYVSDVAAGAFLGAAWAVGVIVVGEWWTSRRRSALAAPPAG